MKQPKMFLILFISASFADIMLSLVDMEVLHMVTKPCIMLGLTGYYLSKASAYSIMFTGAMLFCWLGDIFLLFQSQKELFFIAGLVSFLTAHCLYIFSYRQHRTAAADNALLNVQKLRLSFPVLLAGSGLVIFLYPVLGDMKIPVMIYASVLVAMVLNALFRYGRTSPMSFWLVFTGAILFMASDALLAINKFASPLPFGGLMIMATYCLGQYFIVEGILRSEK